MYNFKILVSCLAKCWFGYRQESIFFIRLPWEWRYLMVSFGSRFKALVCYWESWLEHFYSTQWLVIELSLNVVSVSRNVSPKYPRSLSLLVRTPHLINWLLQVSLCLVGQSIDLVWSIVSSSSYKICFCTELTKADTKCERKSSIQ